MDFQIVNATKADKPELAELRVIAMQESLEAIGRFDPDRARNRLLDEYNPAVTYKVEISGELAGFYVLEPRKDYLWLAHLYFHPGFQGCGVGSEIITAIKVQAKQANLPVRLGALRQSRSNDFYRKHGFEQTHEDAWDIYYEYAV